MPFSAATCLTYTGTTTLGNTLDVYVDSDSYTSLFTTVSLIDITTNCPYYFLNVPDGTHNIKLFDPESCCYCIIPVQSSDLCTTCNLNFDTYSATTIGQIVAGYITGSCEENITDYIVSWYETSDPLTPVFTSGYGTEFEPYLYPHPLTGTSSVLVPSGTYEAIIDKIIINGITFSQTSGEGLIPANLDCLPTFIVDALKCNNGNSSNLPQYEHRFQFSEATGGVLPQPLSTTFELSANTNFFVWKFRGFTVPDEIKLTLIGSSYAEPIILEYWDVGSGLVGNNFNINTFPKSADTSAYFAKITCLTGMTINNGDNILIEVIPSTTTTQTNWDFYCGCSDEFNCDFCEPSSATTVSGTTSWQLPIIGSTITGITGACDVININFSLSGCTTSAANNYDLLKYANVTNFFVWDLDGVIQRFTGNLFLSNRTCFQSTSSNNTTICDNNGSTITYEKSSNLFRVTSNSATTISGIYNDYLTYVIPHISFAFQNDPTNIAYYRYFELQYPNSTGITPCGDGTTQRLLQFHQSSIVTTGNTGSDFFIEFTMPLMTYGLTGYTTCDLNCESTALSITNQINNYVTSPSFNYTGTTTVGSKYTRTVRRFIRLSENNAPNSATTIQSFVSLSNFQNVTVPASGVSYTLLPSLSGEACTTILDNFYDTNGVYPNNQSFFKYYARYRVELFDPLDYQNFRIFADEISLSGEVNTSIRTLVYEFSGGTVTFSNPEYII